MKIAEVSIRNPVLITCIVILMLATGIISLLKLPVDQFPNVEIPYLRVTIIYKGAGPEEMEKLVAKPLEEEIRTIPGVQKIMSFTREGVCTIVTKFPLEINPQYVEQQLRDRTAQARRRMPKDIDEPIIRRHSISDQPMIQFAVRGLTNRQLLYEIAEKRLKPGLEQVDKVSHVLIYGGSKREIQVLLSRNKLSAYELSLRQIASTVEMSGENIPLGKSDDTGDKSKQWIFRSLWEYNTLKDIGEVMVKFYGNDVPVRLGDIAEIVDTTEDRTSYSFVNGQPTVTVDVYRQSGANTVAVAENVKRRLSDISRNLRLDYPGIETVILRDGAKSIRDDIADVRQSILLGIILTIIVVFLFLGNLRSTIITGIAIPNSLIGAFLFVAIAGFTVNLLTLLALSLAVGLLIDDAIVVRENIFRHLKMGKTAEQAALEGTSEVGLAVIATTLAVLSVFGPIGFVGGIPGKFLKEFGLTVCFIMLISLFDALTVGPMLSALFLEGKAHKPSLLEKIWNATFVRLADAFAKFQDNLTEVYVRISSWTLKNSGKVLLIGVVFFLLSLTTCKYIPKTFVPAPDMGEMLVTMEFEPGVTLDTARDRSLEVDKLIHTNPEVAYTSLVVGDENGDSSMARIYLRLVERAKRRINTTRFKEKIRPQLSKYAAWRIQVRDFDNLFGGQRPFVIHLMSDNDELLQETGKKVMDELKTYKGALEVDWNRRPGKPEMRLVFDEAKNREYGISSKLAGAELRSQIEGIIPAKFREGGEEWNIRVRLRESDRNLKENFNEAQVLNMNNRLIHLNRVAELKPVAGQANIYRENGKRVLEISSDIATGYGIGDIIQWMKERLQNEKLIPPGVTFSFGEQSGQYSEMIDNFLLAAGLAILFIYLVLASLYGSFLIPFNLLIPLPLAFSGALIALLIGRQSLNIFSIIAIIMLLGIATKNSILLIDFTKQLQARGMDLKTAIITAGKTRLRPILMTSMALIAGTLPLAIGLNESSKQRASMGWVIIGGVITSTFLTLVVVPASLNFFRRKDRKGKPTQKPPKSAS
jgi:hydrophobic/amphiphilic exporter-1 (mainly G- bacteria), HAE1 family